MGRPKTHDERTERELLSAAERLLLDEGVEGLSVRRLAEAAGTSARAIYSLFGDKRGLVAALFREAFGALREDIAALPVTDDVLADAVAAGAQGFRGWALARPALFRLVFETAPRAERGGGRIAAGVEAFEGLVERLRRCAQAGLIPTGSEPQVAIAYHALCEGLAALELRGRFPLTPDQDPAKVWEGALAALVKGFG